MGQRRHRRPDQSAGLRSLQTPPEREDIEAEMKVRRVEPPFDLVRDAVDTLIGRSRKATAELLKDPNRLARAEQELSAQIALHAHRGC